MNGGEIREKEENDRGKKRVKETPIDPFGELPDSLLIQILSFLNVKEAAITSVLSKRWESLWAELPRLEFLPDKSKLDGRGTGVIDKVRVFVSWVNRTLAVRTGNYLEKFEVDLLYHTVFSSDVDAWVQFATENKVKKLNLLTFGFDGFYTPPQAMYSCASLRKLKLAGCIMHSKTAIAWHSLTNLNLFEVIVDQLLLDEILSSCPVLYILSLIGCRGFNILEVTSPSVAKISVVDCVNNEDATPLKISAPHVRLLDIMLPLRRRKFKIGNISSLARADIDYMGVSWVSISVEVMSGAKELLESVHNAKELRVGWEFVRVVSMMATNGWQLPKSRRELLIVSFESEYDQSTSGIIGLLESSPNLETLVIFCSHSAAEGKDVILEPAARDDLASDLLHLKTVRIKNFADSKGEPLLTLARVLLKRATVLEKMVITICVPDLRIVNTILTYPRSSTKAVVHFNC